MAQTTEIRAIVRQSPPVVLGDGPEAFGNGSAGANTEAFGRAERSTGEKGKRNGHEKRKDEEREDAKGRKGKEDEEEDEESEGEEEGEKKKKGAKPEGPPLYKRPAFLIGAGIVAVVLIVAGILFWLWYRQYESTDDAYIDGHVTQVSPQVTAPVKMLHVDDNQMVHKGDLLVELDPTDYQVALDQAKAQVTAAEGRLSQAQAQIAVAHAGVTEVDAEIDAAQVSLETATNDRNRYENVDERARSQQQLDNAIAAQKKAQSQVAESKARRISAQANITTAEAAVKAAQGEVGQAEAAVERAEVNLGYCRIVAPVDGRVTQRTAENGNIVMTGQAMLSLVAPDVWVTANYKETQLANMKPGQGVVIRVDALGGKKFQGHVDSIQAGSGARFSVLPAENATGNFVKIVQRVPVKIVFDQGVDGGEYGLLSPGLSVKPRVKVR